MRAPPLLRSPPPRLGTRLGLSPPVPLSPVWWAPLFCGLLLIGLVWLMVYYISSGAYPVPGISWWNIVIGLGIMMVGFLMTLWWR